MKKFNRRKKEMKKLLSLVAFMLVFVCLLASCGDENDNRGNNDTNPPEHIHLFGEWEVLKPATCIDNGENAQYCSCGEKQTEVVYVTGIHSEFIDKPLAPTCTASGLTEGKHCSICNYIIVPQEVISALGHSEVIDKQIAPTCTENGLTAGAHCSVCNEMLVEQNVIESKGHNEVIAPEIAATCTQSGLTEGKYCSTCDEIIVAQIVVPSHHIVSDWIIDTPATHTTYGKKYKECTVCHVRLALETISMLPHSESDWIVGAPASCETDGYRYVVCTECGKNLNYEIIPSTGHKHEWVIDTPATCLVNGYKHLECVVCGEVKASETVINAKGHVKSEWIIEKEPTCTEKGVKYNECINCGTRIDSFPIPSNGHDYQITYVIESSNCEDWLEISTCHCGKEITRQMYRHKMSDFEVTVEPGCTTYGKKVKKCLRENCDYIYTESTMYSGHDYHSQTIEQTDTEEGYDIVTCGRCYDTYFDNFVLANNTSPELNYTKWYTADVKDCYILSLDPGKIFTDSVLIIPSTYKLLPVVMVNWEDFTSDRAPNLEKIVFSDNISHFGGTMGKLMFKNYNTLKEIVLGNGISGLLSEQLESKSLEIIRIPKSVKKIDTLIGWYEGEDSKLLTVYFEGNLLEWCKAVKCPINSKYNLYLEGELLTDLVIPEEINSIGSAFYGCQSLNSVRIHGGITTIPSCAFENCTSLKSVVIEEGVTKIENSAFRDCPNITEFIIPFSMSSVDQFAFGSTSGQINGLPVQIGGTSFNKGYYLGNDQNPYYMLFTAGGIYGITGGLEIHPDTKIINDYVGYDSVYLTEITIPDGVISIGEKCFTNTALTEITFPNTLEYIGKGSFSHPYNSVITTEIKIIVIPDSVAYIGDNTFEYLNNLETVVVGENVEYIGRFAFASCYSLSEILVDENNSHFKSINGDLYSKDGSTLVRYSIGKDETDFIVPNDVKIVGAYAFYESKLGKIYLGNNINTIEQGAFVKCSLLTELSLPNQLTYLGDYAFSGCQESLLVEYDNALYIGSEENPFMVLMKAKDTTVTSCVIHPQTKFISNDAFSQCDSLYEIVIPDSVISIGESAFKDCRSLTSLVIGDSITSIGESAFYLCDLLTSIVIPDSVTSIGYKAFYGWTSLSDVYYIGTEVEWGSISIDSYNIWLTNATIHYNYVPEE